MQECSRRSTQGLDIQPFDIVSSLECRSGGRVPQEAGNERLLAGGQPLARRHPDNFTLILQMRVCANLFKLTCLAPLYDTFCNTKGDSHPLFFRSSSFCCLVRSSVREYTTMRRHPQHFHHDSYFTKHFTSFPEFFPHILCKRCEVQLASLITQIHACLFHYRHWLDPGLTWALGS